MTEKRVSIDFDGVIHDYTHPIPGYHMGGVIDDAKKALLWFKERNFQVIIFTANDLKTVHKFLSDYNLYFHVVTNQKFPCDYYIDDKAIRFTNWKDVIQDIESKKYD